MLRVGGHHCARWKVATIRNHDVMSVDSGSTGKIVVVNMVVDADQDWLVETDTNFGSRNAVERGGDFLAFQDASARDEPESLSRPIQPAPEQSLAALGFNNEIDRNERRRIDYLQETFLIQFHVSIDNGRTSVVTAGSCWFLASLIAEPFSR